MRVVEFTLSVDLTSHKRSTVLCVILKTVLGNDYVCIWTRGCEIIFPPPAASCSSCIKCLWSTSSLLNVTRKQVAFKPHSNDQVETSSVSGVSFKESEWDEKLQVGRHFTFQTALGHAKILWQTVRHFSAFWGLLSNSFKGLIFFPFSGLYFFYPKLQWNNLMWLIIREPI